MNQPFDVLCVGELVIDLLSTEQVPSLKEADTFRRYLGGAPTNVARNIVALGGRSALLAATGQDELGEWARQVLREEGVNIENMAVVPAPTTLVLITRHATTPHFLVYRGADRYLSPGHVTTAIVRRARALHTSAFALSLPPLREAVLQALRLAAEAEMLISFDPNFHPLLWEEPEEALAYIAQATAYATVVKPSLDDCARLFGTDSEKACAQRFLEWGARHVFVSQGARGVFWMAHTGESAHIPAHDVPVADVTGAGDAFWAGVLLALLDGLSPLQAGYVGQYVAEHKLQRVGSPVQNMNIRTLYPHISPERG